MELDANIRTLLECVFVQAGIKIDRQIQAGIEIDRQIYAGIEIDRQIYAGIEIDRQIYAGIEIDRQRYQIDIGRYRTQIDRQIVIGRQIYICTDAGIKHRQIEVDRQIDR